MTQLTKMWKNAGITRNAEINLELMLRWYFHDNPEKLVVKGKPEEKN